jgi:hypothetical protein
MRELLNQYGTLNEVKSLLDDPKSAILKLIAACWPNSNR